MRAAAPLLCALLAAGMARGEPDAALLGEAQGYPVGTAAGWYQNPYRVGSWSALDQVPGMRVRRVAASAQAHWQQASSSQDPEPGREREALWIGVPRSLGGRTD